MASILYDMKEQREELERRLKDFDTLENELYPEIKEVVEDLGYDYNVSLNLSSNIYGVFRIGAYKNNRAVSYIDVAFPTRASAGDYVVTQLDSRGLSKIRREVVAPEDLIDIIESYLAGIPEMESKAAESGVKTEDAQTVVKDAFDEISPKLFKIEFVDNEDSLDIYPKTPNGATIDVSWRVLPDLGVLAQYADDFHGGSTIEREIQFADLDELKAVMVDEFNALEETLGFAP